MRSVLQNIVCALLAASAAALPIAASAQTFPSRPLRLIVGFAPGGPTDVMNRIVADQMGKQLGQPVVVENRPGANSLLAAQAVKNAAPDGYTLFGGVVTVFAPVFMKENPIVASKEMAPVAGTISGDWFMYVPSNLGVASIKDLVAWAKANPGKLRFAAPATSNQMLMAVVAKRLGIDFENIPYKASDQTIPALLNGDAQVTFNGASGFLPHVQTGKLRAIATLAAQRTALLPEVATATEQGIPLVLRFTHGVWTTLGTPRESIQRLNDAVNQALRDPKLIETARNGAVVVAPMGPEEMIRTYESQIQFFSEAASLIGFKPQ